MRAVVRVDASEQIGLGHVMRCLALAQVLRSQGAEVDFICRTLSGHAMDLIRAQGFRVVVLRAPTPGDAITERRTKHAEWLGVDWFVDRDETLSVLQTMEIPDWLIIDNYALDDGWERAMRGKVRNILVIDDLSDRRHDCDALLNQNYAQDPRSQYHGLLGDSARILAGPRYALLRPEFAAIRATVGKRLNVLKRLLVFLGGADPHNETGKVLQALEHPDFEALTVDIVVGASNPHLRAIMDRCVSRPRWQTHSHIPDFHRLMVEADLAIGAPGSAAWERCVVGLPSIMIAVADNQHPIGEMVAALGAGIYLGPSAGVSVKDIVASIQRIAVDPARLGDMRKVGRKLVDGKGAQRVALALFPRTLRIAVVSDPDSWINRYIPALVQAFESVGHTVWWGHKVGEIPLGDCAFYLSCGQLSPPAVLARNLNNLVVHESPLPLGKGWAPLTWQILEGNNKIPVLLLEAADSVDSGDVYLTDQLIFDGYELCADLRESQARATLGLCRRFIDHYPWLLTDARVQQGDSSFYPRRTPEDSRLDPDKTLREQFALLRVVDNDRYPAFFELGGHEYTIRVDHRRNSMET